MKNLLNVVKERTQDLNKSNKTKFNTNDFLLEILLNKKILRNEVIQIITSKRLELLGHTEETLSKMKEDELNDLIQKLYKTSKNGLDTSVSDSNNNSSFSYNPSYSDYKLIKDGSYLEIKKISK